MKRSQFVLAALLVTALTGACTRVPPSFSGVKVDYWASDDKGAITSLGRGAVGYNPLTQDVFLFPLHIQRQAYKADKEEGIDTSITVRSGKDNTTVNFDAGLAYSFAEAKVQHVFTKFRTDPETLANGYIKDTVRNSFQKAAADYTVMELLGAKLTEMQMKAETIAKAALEPEGIIVDQLFITGQPRINPGIEDSINKTLQAIQEANRSGELVRKAENDAKAREATAKGEANAAILKAEGEARANKLIAESLNQYGTGVLQQRAIERWNGVMPTVVGGNGATPFINIPNGR